MQRPEWVMMRLPENIQACLRDFQKAAASMAHMRHLHLTQGVYYVFVLFHHSHPFNPSNPRVTHCPGIGIFCLAEFVALKEEVSQQVGRKEAK